MMDETLEHADGDRAAERPRFALGASIAQFRIVRELGSGGMGIVLEAHDAELDRRVAIKVVREPSSAAGLRLVHEAQAMAKLAHPNVVPVHEVGTLDGQVFVVMELVDGETLARWLEHPRTWREVMSAFLQAGEGLAAAHHAGLVHRDFKPSNVLIDRSGHVRVGDFGLARGDADDGGDPMRGAGTPAFMAPEQLAGEAVDARADQYSFAVALAGALATASGSPPRRARIALARARAAEPVARFPSLDPLLAELRRSLGSRRRTIAAGGAGIAVATAAIVALVARPTADDCASGAALVDAVWTSSVRVEQIARFSVLRPKSIVAIGSTAQLLDNWSSAWRLGRRAACRADMAQRPARLACLDRDLGELRAQLDVWSAADPEVVDRALPAAAHLPDPGMCATRTGNPPTLLALAVGARVAGLDAAARAGHPARAVPLIAPLLAAADATQDAATIAGAYLAAANVERAIGELAKAHDHVVRAAREGGHAGDDELLFRTLETEATLSTDLGQPRAALGIIDAAEAVAERAHIDRPDRIASIRGDALTQAGDVQPAIAELERAVALGQERSERLPAARLGLSTSLGELAAAHAALRDYAKAAELLRRALALDETMYGPAHPEVARTLHDLANNEARLGNFDSALAHDARARAIFVASYGERALLVAMVDFSVASIVDQAKGDDLAEPLFLQAQVEMATAAPPEHPYQALIEESLGQIARDRDRCKDAIPHFAHALAIVERSGTVGTEHARHLTNLGACLLDVGRSAEARPMIERAIAEEVAAGVPPIDRSQETTLIADIEYLDGHHAKAIAMAHELLALLGEHPAPPYQQYVVYEHQQLAKWTK